MQQLSSIPNRKEMQKGLKLLGLDLSEAEFGELQAGHTISLENRSLGEIGSVFILAAAMSAKNICRQNKKIITFQDLPNVTTDLDAISSCSGIPIYCWSDDSCHKCCIYLTVVKEHPAVRCCTCKPTLSKAKASEASEEIADRPCKVETGKERAPHRSAKPQVC